MGCPANLLARALLLTAVALSTALAISGQALPSEEQCLSYVQSQGDNGLLLKLQPCQSGPSASCCSTVQGLAGFPGSGPLAGCLCRQSLLEQLLSGLQSNKLAKIAGVTRQSTLNILQTCGVAFFGGTGAATCPAAAPAPAGGPSVSVAAPFTGVQVAPGGKVGVTAPGTNVQVGGAPTGAPAQAPAAAAPAPPAAAPAAAPAPSGVSALAGGGAGIGSGALLKAKFCKKHPYHPLCKNK